MHAVSFEHSTEMVNVMNQKSKIEPDTSSSAVSEPVAEELLDGEMSPLLDAGVDPAAIEALRKNEKQHSVEEEIETDLQYQTLVRRG